MRLPVTQNDVSTTIVQNRGRTPGPREPQISYLHHVLLKRISPYPVRIPEEAVLLHLLFSTFIFLFKSYNLLKMNK
jgi:hypothetical protein